MSDKPRRFVPPLGWPFAPRVLVVRPAERQRRIVALNRYPRQAIGLSVRLPSITDRSGFGPTVLMPIHLALSIVWSKPARWWR